MKTNRERAGDVWNVIWKRDFVNVHHVAAMDAIESALDEAVAEERDTMLKIAEGCSDYGGGYRGTEMYEAYQHGIGTVCNALRAFVANGADSQINSLIATANDARQQTTRGAK